MANQIPMFDPDYVVFWKDTSIYSTQPGKRLRLLAAISDELGEQGWFWSIVRKDWVRMRRRQRKIH